MTYLTTQIHKIIQYNDYIVILYIIIKSSWQSFYQIFYLIDSRLNNEKYLDILRRMDTWFTLGDDNNVTPILSVRIVKKTAHFQETIFPSLRDYSTFSVESHNDTTPTDISMFLINQKFFMKCRALRFPSCNIHPSSNTNYLFLLN